MSTLKTNQELQEYSREHLCYEIQMLTASWEKVFGRSPNSDWNTRMALLESLVSHARVLGDFLFGKSSRTDDVIASEFFESELTWLEFEAQNPMPYSVARIRRRTGKEIVHLTSARINGPDSEKDYHIGDFDDLLKALGRFAVAASRRKLHPNARLVALQAATLALRPSATHTTTQMTVSNVGYSTVVAPFLLGGADGDNRRGADV
jgi:hypothetical protein